MTCPHLSVVWVTGPWSRAPSAPSPRAAGRATDANPASVAGKVAFVADVVESDSRRTRCVCPLPIPTALKPNMFAALLKARKSPGGGATSRC